MARALITTPKGTAVYPHLHAPDTKFQAEGIYSTKLTLSAADASPLIDQLEEMIEAYRPEAQKTAKGKRLKEADRPWVENEDGTFTFNFKLKASGKTREGKEFTQAPALFDAAGTPTPGLKVGGGSLIRVAFEPSAFFTALLGIGITLRLKAVQVIELREFGGRSAGGFGFGAEEGFQAGPGSPFGGDEDGDSEEETTPPALGDGDDF